MTILLLGGNGFIGGHVAHELAKRGHSVRLFDRATGSRPLRDTYVEQVRGDYRDPFAVAEALEGIDVVFHAVSSTVPSTSNLDPIADIQENLIPSVQLLRTMVEAKVNRIVFLSSGGTIYGNTSAPAIKEDHPRRPICSYGIVKAAIENYLRMFQELKGMKCCILRPSNPYGPWQRHHGVQGVIATFLRRVLEKKSLVVWGSGEVSRDYIYISDLAELCVRAIEKGASGVYNAGSGIPYSINDVIQTIREETGAAVTINHQESRDCDVKASVLDCTSAQAEFDWRPRICLRDGVRLLWSWLNSNARDQFRLPPV